MPKTTIEYDIPKKAELAAKFAEEAQYSEDGKQVTVGRFIARRNPETIIDAIFVNPIIGFNCIDTEKQKTGTRCKFFIAAKRHPDDQGKVFLRRTDQLENVIPELAAREAELQLTNQDHQSALKAALEAKLVELG